MLHTESVHEGTLELLEELMSLDFLKSFSLVGGTALALKFGHRISEDLDLFSIEDFDKYALLENLKNQFGERMLYEERGNVLGIFCYIDKVKVDIIKYRHPLIKPVEMFDSIRFYSVEDIIAMKVAAILRRAKKKDFWDIAELLKHYSVEDFVQCFYKKFPSQMLAISIPQAMTFFAEAEADDDPISLKKQNWKSVKNLINKSVMNYLK